MERITGTVKPVDRVLLYKQTAGWAQTGISELESGTFQDRQQKGKFVCRQRFRRYFSGFTIGFLFLIELLLSFKQNQ